MCKFCSLLVAILAERTDSKESSFKITEESAFKGLWLRMYLEFIGQTVTEITEV